MSSTVMKVTSTTAAAIITGVGIINPSSTDFMPHRLIYSMTGASGFFAPIQTSSSVVQWKNIVELCRIGEDNFLRIQEIARLKKGWDGHKARPIPDSVISRTKALLMVLPSGAKVFPTSRSTTQIEYHKGEDDYLEIEVAPKSYEIYSVKGNDEFESSVNKRELKKRVVDFLG